MFIIVYIRDWNRERLIYDIKYIKLWMFIFFGVFFFCIYFFMFIGLVLGGWFMFGIIGFGGEGMEIGGVGWRFFFDMRLYMYVLWENILFLISFLNKRVNCVKFGCVLLCW